MLSDAASKKIISVHQICKRILNVKLLYVFENYITQQLLEIFFHTVFALCANGKYGRHVLTLRPSPT